MNLITADIIPSINDALWEDASPLVSDHSSKPVLVITNEYEAGSPEEAQLKKMLEAACKLNAQQYHIITLKEGQKAAWHQLKELLDPKIVFLIGIMPLQLGISALFAINYPNNFDGCIWLPTVPGVMELERNLVIKKDLWNNGMNPIFIAKKFGHL